MVNGSTIGGTSKEFLNKQIVKILKPHLIEKYGLQPLLQQQKFAEFKPESMNSFEVGYKTLIAKKLLIDFLNLQFLSLNLLLLQGKNND